MPRRSAMKPTIKKTVVRTKSPGVKDKQVQSSSKPDNLLGLPMSKVKPKAALIKPGAKPAAPAKTRPRRMLAYRLESGAAMKEVLMVPYNGETDFRDVWSYHDLVSGFFNAEIVHEIKTLMKASSRKDSVLQKNHSALFADEHALLKRTRHESTQ